MNAHYSTIKFFTSPEKEEAWLEQMALRGWFLIKVSSFPMYTFEQRAPEKRVYKIDYRAFKNPADREDYLALFRDSGWQPVMPREVNSAFYFFSSQPDAVTDIFSDAVSRAQRNLRYATLSACSILPAFIPLLALYLTGSFKLSSVGYLTPGLWDMQGMEFVFHFLFETPFVLLRGGAYVLPLVPLALMLFFIIRYYRAYHKAVRQQAI